MKRAAAFGLPLALVAAIGALRLPSAPGGERLRAAYTAALDSLALALDVGQQWSEQFTEIVDGLNRRYRQQNRPYRIRRYDDGFELSLLPQYRGVQDRMAGSPREARLSQAALDVLALVAKVLRNRGRQIGGTQADERWIVRGGRDNDRPGQAFRAEVVLDEPPHFAAALADQPNHRHVRRSSPRHHAEQRALADAAAPKHAEPLPQARGRQRVDRANARRDGRHDRIARKWVEGRWVQQGAR